MCVLLWTGLSESSLAPTGSGEVSVLTFYLLQFALAAGVEGSEEQLVPSPVTPTSPIPDTPPQSRQIPLFTLLQVRVCVSEYLHLCVCVRASGYSPSVCHAGRRGSFPFALDKHFLSVNTGEPGTPQFPDEYTHTHTHT